jgi:hypothetical protein
MLYGFQEIGVFSRLVPGVSQTQLRSVTASEARIIYKKTELFDKE